MGSLGSSQPSTIPSSTSQVSFLLDITVLVRFSLAYAQICGFRRPRASMNQLNWSSLLSQCLKLWQSGSDQPVHVLGGSECVGDSLNAVNNGAGKVIRGINLGDNHDDQDHLRENYRHLVLGASSRVCLRFTSVDSWVSKATIQRLHVDLGSHLNQGHLRGMFYIFGLFSPHT